MSIPQLGSCCFGCSLKTGTKIIGWLCLIGFILMVTTVSLTLAALYYIEEHPNTDDPAQKELITHIPVLKAFAMFFIAIYAIGTALSVMLLMGVYQEKANLVFYWVVVMAVSIILSFVLHIVEIITIPQQINPYEIFALVIDVYFILVVYSYYREIRNVSNYA